MKAKKEIPVRNKSPFGWWIAAILLRYEEQGEDRKNLSRRCLAWVNTIIIKAKNREEAYRKAIFQGESHQSKKWDSIDTKTRRKGRWNFEGLMSLLPIYEELEDGAEVLWDQHKVSVKRVKSWVKSKKELETFQD